MILKPTPEMREQPQRPGNGSSIQLKANFYLYFLCFKSALQLFRLLTQRKALQARRKCSIC